MSRELSLVNAMIGTLGEAPLVEVDDGHPLVATAKAVIEPTRRELLGRGWWFNTETRDLTPDPTTKFIYLPGDALQLDAKYHRTIQPRGRRLYDTSTGSFIIADSPVAVRFFSDVSLDDLPEVFYTVLSHECKIRFQTAYDADQLKMAELNRVAAVAMLYLKAEHTRCVKANIHNRDAMQVGLANMGVSGRLRLPIPR